MKYKNILVPFDRSESAKNALSTALEFANEAEGAKITVFYATPIPEFESTEFMIAERMSGSKRMSNEDIKGLQEDYLNHVRTRLAEDLGDVAASDAVKLVVGQGKPSKAILDYAADNKIDLIIMGCRGLSAVTGMLGSVSYAVLRNAECPVLIEK